MNTPINIRVITYFIGLLVFCIPSKVRAADKKDTLYVGVYVNDIYDIDYKKGTYKISFYLWTNSYNNSYNLKDWLDIHNQASFQTERSYVDSFPGLNGRKVYWSEIRGTAEIIKAFDVSKFPFDNEQLKLTVEFTFSDYKNLHLIIDTTSILDKVNMPMDWKIIKPSITKQITYYKTSFGDPLSNTYDVQTIDIVYDLGRNSKTLFIKLFVAVFISFLIACSSIFISNDSFEPRFSLIVGGLFGTISNKYVTESYLPDSSLYNLSDKIHFITIFFLLLLTVVTIIENRLKLEDNKTYEKVTFFALLVSYIIAICTTVYYL